MHRAGPCTHAPATSSCSSRHWDGSRRRSTGPTWPSPRPPGAADSPAAPSPSATAATAPPGDPRLPPRAPAGHDSLPERLLPRLRRRPPGLPRPRSVTHLGHRLVADLGQPAASSCAAASTGAGARSAPAACSRSRRTTVTPAGRAPPITTRRARSTARPGTAILRWDTGRCRRHRARPARETDTSSPPRACTGSMLGGFDSITRRACCTSWPSGRGRSRRPTIEAAATRHGRARRRAPDRLRDHVRAGPLGDCRSARPSCSGPAGAAAPRLPALRCRARRLSTRSSTGSVARLTSRSSTGSTVQIDESSAGVLDRRRGNPAERMLRAEARILEHARRDGVRSPIRSSMRPLRGRRRADPRRRAPVLPSTSTTTCCGCCSTSGRTGTSCTSSRSTANLTQVTVRQNDWTCARARRRCMPRCSAAPTLIAGLIRDELRRHAGSCHWTVRRPVRPPRDRRSSDPPGTFRRISWPLRSDPQGQDRLERRVAGGRRPRRPARR